MAYIVPRECADDHCKNVVFGVKAICPICLETRCPQHWDECVHPCGTLGQIYKAKGKTAERLERLEKEFERQDMIDLFTLLRSHQNSIIVHAQSLRPGHLCELDLPELDVTSKKPGLQGTFNCHFRLTFDDGLEWLVRVRRNRRDRPPEDMCRAVMCSEVATMNFLKQHGIPVPDAWLPATARTADNPSRTEQDDSLDYFFCDFLPGETLVLPARPLQLVDTAETHVIQFLRDYTRFQISLANSPYHRGEIGSLLSYQSNVGYTMGPLINKDFFHTLQPPYFLGPFKNNRDRYVAHIDAALEFITQGAICCAYPLDAYLWRLELRDLVRTSALLQEEPTEVYVCHADMKEDVFLFEEGRLTGVLDWEWAYFTTKAEAFAAPPFAFIPWMHIHGTSLTRMETLLMECYNSFNRADLAECVRNGRIYHYLRALIGQEYVGVTLDVLQAARDTLRRLLGVIPTSATCHEERWLALLERYPDDDQLHNLMDHLGVNTEMMAEVVRQKRAEREASVQARRAQWAARKTSRIIKGEM